MSRTIVANLLAFSVGHVGWSATYTVKNTQSAGTDSFRWAVNQADDHPGPDRIEFAPALSGQSIEPRNAFPPLMDDGTTINGDIDGDGKPDIVLNGRRQSGGGSGLVVAGDGCEVVGLAIVRFPGTGLLLATAANCRIRSCHIGVSLSGAREALNGENQISLFFAHKTQIGDGTRAGRNVIAAGRNGGMSAAIMAVSSMGNTIKGNYIGVTRDGMSALGSGDAGIVLYTWLFGAEPGTRPRLTDGAALIAAEQNIIGGRTPGERNVIGGVGTGVVLSGAPSNVIQGNYFGLARDGSTVVAVGRGVATYFGSSDNLIGGTSPGARNVFAGALVGVAIGGEGSDGNKVEGNYFGPTASGTEQRRLRIGVMIGEKAGPQTIGGNTVKAGNYFAPKPAADTTAILLLGGGSGTVIRRNKLGIRPDGVDAAQYACGIWTTSRSARILDNTIVRAGTGILAEGSSAPVAVFRNRFRRCDTGVKLTGSARCLLGDLGNATTADDGGNVFRSIGTWFIRNETARLVKAEGNDFSTTSRAAIDAKVFDRKDNSGYGRVDFNPLAGGVLPTGTTDPVPALTGVVAVPRKAGGAEVAFTLSAPADVTAEVLNIAGRPVAMVARAAAVQAGTQRFIWSGQTYHGTAAPSGAYLVRVSVHDAGGHQTQAVVVVKLRK